MDNLCHTLVGAALGEAGLKTRTRFGNPALMIAANLPDVDVLVFATGTPSVVFRRGWTHGVLAQAVLPIAFTALLMLWDRWRPGRPGDPPLRAGTLLMLSYIGVISHVLLDLLNNYGVRILMPLSGRWFYGDSVFIVDIWLWLTLGAGVFLARRRRRLMPARVALLAAVAYILVIVGSAAAARRAVVDAWVAGHGTAPRSLMVGPLPVTPLSRAVVIDAGDHYETGTFHWLGRRLELAPERLPRRDSDPAVVEARQDPRFRAILTWSRFPYYEVDHLPEGTRVTLRDLRFLNLPVGRAVVIVPGS